MSLHIFRVTVRGRFADLTDDARQQLLAEADDHDVVTAAAFTETGTLTYERTVDFFTFRFQLRAHGDDAEAEAAVTAEARERAEAYLGERGLGWRDLRVQARDMASIWR